MMSNQQIVEQLLSDEYWRGGGVRPVDEKKLIGEYPILAQPEMGLQLEYGPKVHADYAYLKKTNVVETPMPDGRPLPLIMGNIISKKMLRIVMDERIVGPEAASRKFSDPNELAEDLMAIDEELEKPFAEQRWTQTSQAIGTLAVELANKSYPATVIRSVYYAHNALGEGALVGALAHYLEPFRIPERGHKDYRAFFPMIAGTTYDVSGTRRGEYLQRVVQADKVEQTYYAALSDEARRIADSLGRLIAPQPTTGFAW